jgi:rhodanese-related sulfurtransferase
MQLNKCCGNRATQPSEHPNEHPSDRRLPEALARMATAVWFILAASSSVALSATKQVVITPAASKAYCGIRCLYSAAAAEGVTLSGAQLMRPEYVGSREGSSIEELELAAREHGLHTLAFADGTISTLRAAAHPVILHVESDPGSGQYDHFVLYLGQRQDKLLVLDPAGIPGDPAQLRSPRDLELIWDGAGIIVSKSPIQADLLTASAGEVALYGGCVICLITLIKLSLPRIRLAPVQRFASLGSAAEVLAIFALATLAPAASALCTDGGFLAHAEQIRLVEQSHAAYFLPRVSLPDAAGRLAAGSAVFVDARYAADYGGGHIRGAISVPVTASADGVRAYMRDVRQNVPVIVYCQSRSCPFSKAVAVMLLKQGYLSVQLLDGGWTEWSAWNH